MGKSLGEDRLELAIAPGASDACRQVIEPNDALKATLDAHVGARFPGPNITTWRLAAAP